MKKILSVLLAAILAVCTLSPALAEQRSPGAPNGSWGLDLSKMSTKDLDGNPVDAEIFKNADITFLNLWATWCGPCVGEMPHIKQMYEHYSETEAQDVQFVGVITNDGSCTPAGAKSFLSTNGYKWLNIIPDSTLRSAFGSNAVPETLIVNRDGIVLDDTGSFSSAKELQEYLEFWLGVTSHSEDECTVTYKNDATGEVIAESKVAYGYALSEAEYPEVADVEGFLFKEWKVTEGGSNVQQVGFWGFTSAGDDVYVSRNIVLGDITITAFFSAEKFKVKFYDNFDKDNPRLLNSQQVEYGKGAVAPQPPAHEGYYFAGWDKDFSKITGDISIYTIWVKEGEEPPVTPGPGTELPGDIDGDGETTVSDAVNIARIAMQIGNTDDAGNPAADFNGDGKVDMSDALATIRSAMGLFD